tara:strand:+ start:5813 stop:6376 length:564 start_codon:yes stop_codon:yes gene_type:complete
MVLIKNIRELQEGLSKLSELEKEIELIADNMAKCLNAKGTIFLAGNGGSCSDAIHIAAELTGRFLTDRIGLPAIALGTNVAEVTSISNDFSFAKIFSRPLKALSRSGDIFIAISTSGNSQNLLEAVDVANKKNMLTIGFLGQEGGLLQNKVKIALRVPFSKTPRIQEIHIFLAHSICELLETKLGYK